MINDEIENLPDKEKEFFPVFSEIDLNRIDNAQSLFVKRNDE